MKNIAILLVISILLNACATTSKVHTLKRLPAHNGHTAAVTQRVNERTAGSCISISCDSPSTKDSQIFQVVEYTLSKLESSISIPIKFTDNKDTVPNTLPEAIINDKRLWKDECNIGTKAKKGIECKLNPNNLTITLDYDKSDAGKTACAAVLTDAIGCFLVVPVLLMPFHLYKCFSPTKITHKFANTSRINLLPYSTDGIKISYKTTPSEIFLLCDSKNCTVVDGNGKVINEIAIEKIYNTDTRRIDMLLAKEKQERNKKAEEERKRKKEAARQERLLHATICEQYARQLSYYLAIGNYLAADRFSQLYQANNCK